MSVDILIVTYNSEKFISACLSSLLKQTFTKFNVMLIDNMSQDKTAEIVQLFKVSQKEKSRLNTLFLDSNRGFAAANCEGLRIANSKYVAFLNPDTQAEAEWLENLVTVLDNDPQIGICASKLIIHDMNQIDSAGDVFTTLLKGDKRGEGKGIENFDQKEFVFGACAGAALYRRKMLDQIGFFDKDFFLIHEDTDLNFRAQLAGWKVLYVPNAIVHHKVRSSIGFMSDTAVYYSLRNSELVRIKNVPFGVFIRCFPEFILGIISEFLYFAVKHKRFNLFMKAKKDALKMFPRMWKKRKIIMKTRQVNNRYLLGLMTPVWQKDFFKTKLKKFLYG